MTELSAQARRELDRLGVRPSLHRAAVVLPQGCSLPSDVLELLSTCVAGLNSVALQLDVDGYPGPVLVDRFLPGSDESIANVLEEFELLPEGYTPIAVMAGDDFLLVHKTDISYWSHDEPEARLRRIAASAEGLLKRLRPYEKRQHMPQPYKEVWRI